MSRKYNFCAGPSALPTDVLNDLKDEILDFQGYGLSTMEMSHRSKEFVSIAAEAKQDLIDLLQINSDYEVLFIQGGATLQFSMVPMNLINADGLCSYLDVGYWSKKAIKEAERLKFIERTQGAHVALAMATEKMTEVLRAKIDFPKTVFMIVDKKIELETKLLKEYAEWQFLPENDLNSKTII